MIGAAEIGWTFVACSVLGAAFFNGSEIGMLSVNRPRLRQAAERGVLRARVLEQLLRDRERLLATFLVGVNLFMISGAAVATCSVCCRPLRSPEDELVAAPAAHSLGPQVLESKPGKELLDRLRACCLERVAAQPIVPIANYRHTARTGLAVAQQWVAAARYVEPGASDHEGGQEDGHERRTAQRPGAVRAFDRSPNPGAPALVVVDGQTEEPARCHGQGDDSHRLPQLPGVVQDTPGVDQIELAE